MSQLKKRIKKIENGIKYGFKIYLESGDKEVVGPFSKEKAKEVKKQLDKNGETYQIIEDYIEDGQTYYKRINTI